MAAAGCATILISLTLFVQLFCFLAPFWIVIGNYYKGLWYTAYDGKVQNEIKALWNALQHKHSGDYAMYLAAVALETIATGLLVLACLWICCMRCCCKNSCGAYSSSIMTFLSVIAIAVAMILYAAVKDWSIDGLHACYWASIGVIILGLCSGVALWRAGKYISHDRVV